MDKDTLLEHLFAQYPAEAGFYLTSDLQAFTEKNKELGLNHSKTLENISFKWHAKPEVEIVSLNIKASDKEIVDLIDSLGTKEATGTDETTKLEDAEGTKEATDTDETAKLEDAEGTKEATDTDETAKLEDAEGTKEATEAVEEKAKKTKS